MTSNLHLFSCRVCIDFCTRERCHVCERCHVYERFVYCTLLSERHVVSFISTFSDVHSVDVLHFLITASARWFCTVLHWITCADAVALDDDVISLSSGKGCYKPCHVLC